MQITNYEDTGLLDLESFLTLNLLTPDNISEAELVELLTPFNVSFSIEQMNRLQSMLLCELKDSYVQQSQRYVTVNNDAYDIPVSKHLSPQNKDKYIELVMEGLELYSKMSEKNPDAQKGRPKITDYKYGIPIEDARYILPVCMKTNVNVAMNASKLIDLYKLMMNSEYGDIFTEMENIMSKFVPENIRTLIVSTVKGQDSKYSNLYYSKYFEKLNPENIIFRINSFKHPEIRTGLGALTSTQQKTSSEVLLDWGDEAAKKASGVTQRVLNYGHSGVAEQARHTFATMMSICSYHQQIRHRLSVNKREPLENLCKNFQHDFIVPPTIEKSPFAKDFVEYVNKVQSFRYHLFNTYGIDVAAYLIMNCDYIKQISSSNARIDCTIMVERLCNTAQWEIRNLYERKFNLLAPESHAIYKYAIPPCVFGNCKEGNLTCGKMQEMREKYKNYIQ